MDSIIDSIGMPVLNSDYVALSYSNAVITNNKEYFDWVRYPELMNSLHIDNGSLDLKVAMGSELRKNLF